MSDYIAKLQIIKELSSQPETKQVCDVLIDYISSIENKGIGFEK